MVCPPSIHASGKFYEWAPGFGPHEISIEPAPEWLIEAIETLREQHGGRQPDRVSALRPSKARTPSAWMLMTAKKSF